MAGRKVLFVDRDGTLIEEPDDFQVDSVGKVSLVPGVMNALQSLRDAGFDIVMVSNQDGLGTDSFPHQQFDEAHKFMLRLFASQGITFSEIFICPHLPADGCECRKPATGLLTAYLAATHLDLANCAVIGDRETDMELANRLGMTGFLIGTKWDWSTIAQELCLRPRRGTVERITSETRIEVAVNLDVDDGTRIATGIGFFDHMLEQIGRHAELGLKVTCNGDLHIDEHHSVEDVALALGDALKQALGTKHGVQRYGFTLPMDESLASVALDLSGRPAFKFDDNFARDIVGGLSIEMVRHFFQSLATALGASIHISVHGDNAHHMVEACFKGMGKVLGQAIRREGSALPSTKGVL